MKILSSYALTTGLIAHKPEIVEEYVPFSKDLAKVVLFNFASPHQSKIYDYGQDVLDIVTPILQKHGYITIQLGNEKDNKLKTEYSLLGMTYAQRAYIVKNSALVVSTENILLHFAGIYNTKNIGIYGPSHPNSHGPVWGEHKAMRNCKNKPSYFTQEFPKSINENKPEDIAKEILVQLDIDENIKYSSVYFGQNYPSLVLEFIPNHLIAPDLFAEKELIIRMDYHFNEECLFHIGRQRKISVIGDKPISLEIIKQIKNNLIFFNFSVTKNTDIIYCKRLKETGAKIVFFSEENEEDLRATRIKFFDIGLVESFTRTKKPLDFENTKFNTSFQFKTYKFILSDGKIFMSKPHWEQNMSISSFNENSSSIIDDVEFWKDIDLFHIYKNEKS